eukprot:396377-Rhodomonas_salina.1
MDETPTSYPGLQRDSKLPVGQHPTYICSDPGISVVGNFYQSMTHVHWVPWVRIPMTSMSNREGIKVMSAGIPKNLKKQGSRILILLLVIL